MPGETAEPLGKTKDSSIDQGSSLNLTQIKQGHKICIKIVIFEEKRVLEQGKWVKVVEPPIDYQINRYKNELSQGDEVIKKLKEQRIKLDDQVNQYAALVEEKVKESKVDEQKRIKKTIENIHHPNRSQFDQVLLAYHR